MEKKNGEFSRTRLVFEDDTPVEFGEDGWLQRTPSKSAMEADVSQIFFFE